VRLQDPYHGSHQLKQVVASAVHFGHIAAYKGPQRQHGFLPFSVSQVTAAATNEGNAIILAAKRDGNLKAVMSQFITMKRQGAALSHHTYNMVAIYD
jgi:hypothetical protein